MRDKTLNAWVGLFVLLGIVALVFLALKAGNLSSFSLGQKFYTIQSQFDNIGNLRARAAVKSAGVVVGRVAAIHFDNQTFRALVILNLDARYQFPRDSSVKILTAGVLGEQYIGLEPGIATRNLQAGDTIKRTQSAIVLENLIGQLLYSKAAAGSTAPQQ